MMNSNYLWMPNCFGSYPSFPIYSPLPLQVAPKDNHREQEVREKYQILKKEHEKLQEKYEQLQKRVARKKKVKRRVEAELNKCHHCPYHPCRKEYASELALELHMRSKHNGGNKRERDRVARMIIDSEMVGRDIPKQRIQLPPGYIEKHRIRLLLMDTSVSDETKREQE